MNQIYQEVLNNRNGHYVHAFEVEGLWELKTIIESICEEHSDKLIGVVIDFLESAELYCLNEEYEDEVYSFNIANYVLECLK